MPRQQNGGSKEHSFGEPFGGYLTPKPSDEKSEMRKHLIAASGEFVGTFVSSSSVGIILAIDRN